MESLSILETDFPIYLREKPIAPIMPSWKRWYGVVELFLLFAVSCGRMTPTPQPIPTTDPLVVETRVAATVFARLTASALPKATVTILQPTSTAPMPTATNTRTPVVTRVAVPTSTATRQPVASPQKRLDFKDGLIVTDIASGNQTKFSSNNETVTSAAWSLDGEKVLITWAKKGTVRKVGDLYACGYEWGWDQYSGWGYKTKWCRYAPDYFPSEYGGSVTLLSKGGQTIADLATGSPEPQFVGDPQITYSDVVWSPDVKRLAMLHKQADGNRCPFVGNPDATGLRKLKDCEADDHPRFWSVDGKWLVTWSDRGLKLFAYEVDGGRRVALEELGGIRMYDQRYFPWRIVDKPACKDSNFWSCE